MKQYLLCLLNRDRHINRAEDFSSHSDILAIATADAMRGEAAAELWEGARKVKGYMARTGTALSRPSVLRR